MSLDLSRPFKPEDRVRHIASGKFGNVRSCEILGMTLGVWSCSVQFDAERESVIIAADQLEIVRRRSGIALAWSNPNYPGALCLPRNCDASSPSIAAPAPGESHPSPGISLPDGAA